MKRQIKVVTIRTQFMLNKHTKEVCKYDSYWKKDSKLVRKRYKCKNNLNQHYG